MGGICCADFNVSGFCGEALFSFFFSFFLDPGFYIVYIVEIWLRFFIFGRLMINE